MNINFHHLLVKYNCYAVVDPVDGNRIQKGTVAETGASFLQIYRVTHADEGNYTCHISTAAGVMESVYLLQVSDPKTSMCGVCYCHNC